MDEKWAGVRRTSAHKAPCYTFTCSFVCCTASPPPATLGTPSARHPAHQRIGDLPCCLCITVLAHCDVVQQCNELAARLGAASKAGLRYHITHPTPQVRSTHSASGLAAQAGEVRTIGMAVSCNTVSMLHRHVQTGPAGGALLGGPAAQRTWHQPFLRAAHASCSPAPPFLPFQLTRATSRSPLSSCRR